MQVDTDRREEPDADALYRPGGYENVIWRKESHQLSTRKRISEKLARSELEAIQRDVRHALLYQNHSKSQSENIKDRKEMQSSRL